jgi:hypothetical protein
MRRVLIGVLLIVTAVAATTAIAGLNRNWNTHLTGEFEVPVRDTQAQAQANFQVAQDGASIDYRLIASNIDNVVAAHIHVAPVGVNGPIVVPLYPSTAGGSAPAGQGRTDGVLVTGTITAADLTGPLAGKTLDDLLAEIEAGNAYVNVHTNDGVAPTNTGPGDFPGGEIRGQLTN